MIFLKMMFHHCRYRCVEFWFTRRGRRCNTERHTDVGVGGREVVIKGDDSPKRDGLASPCRSEFLEYLVRPVRSRSRSRWQREEAVTGGTD